MKPRLYVLTIVLGVVVGCPAHSRIADDAVVAEGKTADAAGKAFDYYRERMELRASQLAQAQKEALASIGDNLRSLAALKREMAEELRCLDTYQAATGTQSVAMFHLCWQGLESENNKLGADLTTLDNNMNLADPNWRSAHPDEDKAIDALYWQKVGIERNVLAFVQTSCGRWFTSHITVDPQQGEALAKKLACEANILDSSAKSFDNLLHGLSSTQPPPGPQC